MQQIRQQLKANSQNESLSSLPDDIYSYLSNYVPKQNALQSKNNELFEEIYNLATEIDLQPFIINEKEESVEFLSKKNRAC